MCAHRDLGVRLFSSQFALIPHDWIIGAQSCTPNTKGRSAGGMTFTRDKMLNVIHVYFSFFLFSYASAYYDNIRPSPKCTHAHLCFVTCAVTDLTNLPF